MLSATDRKVLEKSNVRNATKKKKMTMTMQFKK